MARVQASGIAFGVEERGVGEPLVLLHGFSGSSASWARVSDRLAVDYRVIAIDLIGHGVSDAPADAARYAFDRALDDLAEITGQLSIDRAPWLGYSMGGRLALAFAMKHPRRVSALVLESATPGILDATERAQRRAADETLAQHIENIGIPAFVEEWDRRPMWQSQRMLPAIILQRQRELRLGNRAIGLANSLRGMGQGVQPSFWDRLRDISVPVLLIAGALDGKFAAIAAQMYASIPGSIISVHADAGHAVHLERPDQFADELRQFLARRESPVCGTRQERPT